MRKVFYDLPGRAGRGAAPLLLDANANVYNMLPTGGGYVYVERYAQKKDQYIPLEIGTRSTRRNQAYLIKEQNFRDIGGGFFEFERHYAVKPQNWYNYEMITYKHAVFSFVISKYYLNHTFTGGGVSSALARVDRFYVLEHELESSIRYYNPRALVSDTGEFGEVEGIREDEVSLYAGKIYEIKRYTAVDVTFSGRPTQQEQEEE